MEGACDAFARQVLLRAGFVFQPTLRGQWIRLPFDLGRTWENEHASWAADMLSAAHYPVQLDTDLRLAPSPTPQPASGVRPPPGRLPHR